MTRRERKSIAQMLDQLVPLLGASHKEVVEYEVTVPTRFAEVRARLANGRTTRLSEPRSFLGWRGRGSNPTLLFDCGGQRVVVNTGGPQATAPSKFIARDGGQLALNA